MRTFLLSCAAVILMACPVNAQLEQTDPYSTDLVQTALRLRQQGVNLSSVEKNVARLGDRVSIALLKLLGGRRPQNPGDHQKFFDRSSGRLRSA